MSPDSNSGVLYALVAASSLDAMLTLGDRYDASILKRDPMAPIHPKTNSRSQHGSIDNKRCYQRCDVYRLEITALPRKCR